MDKYFQINKYKKEKKRKRIRKKEMKKEILQTHNPIWHDTKRHFGMPISFTDYFLSIDRLFVRKGILNEQQSELMLYRIKDISVTRTFFQKLFNVGSVTLFSIDASSPIMQLQNIENVYEVKELIHVNVENAKKTRGLYLTEIY